MIAVCLELLANGLHGTVQYDLRMVDEGDMVADFLHGSHVVGGEDNRVPFRFQLHDFLLQAVSVHWVESAERFVQDEQLRFMDNRDDELHLLLHSLRQLFQLLVPPRHDVELLEPIGEPCACLLVAETF